jgi:hypothetical protein
MAYRSMICILASATVLATIAHPIQARSGSGCAVTAASNHPFIPPPPYDKHLAPPDFWLGTPSLWTIIHPGTWKLGANNGAKLPYWRQGFDAEKERDPRLIVVARRLDGPAPLVWSAWANSANADNTPAGMAMVTGFDIPMEGCWEISARYRDQTLTYTVLVKK